MNAVHRWLAVVFAASLAVAAAAQVEEVKVRQDPDAGTGMLAAVGPDDYGYILQDNAAG